MGNDTMDLGQLASLLGRDARELGKLANRGQLPGRKIGGEWRFATAEIHHWIESELPHLSDRELRAIDQSTAVADEEGTPLVSPLMPLECIDLSLPARTRRSVIAELVKLAENSNQVWDPDAIRHAVEAREEMSSTARPEGFAIPHPRRRMPNTLGDSVIALGRTSTTIPFGGSMVDLFFLVCCTDDSLHLRVQARLARLLRTPGLLDALRSAETPAEAWGLIDSAERELTT